MASKRRRRRRECTDKKQYETREQAWHALMGMYRSGLLKVQRQVYRCQWCGKFHVGRGAKHFKRQKVKQWMLLG